MESVHTDLLSLQVICLEDRSTSQADRGGAQAQRLLVYLGSFRNTNQEASHFFVRVLALLKKCHITEEEEAVASDCN